MVRWDKLKFTVYHHCPHAFSEFLRFRFTIVNSIVGPTLLFCGCGYCNHVHPRTNEQLSTEVKNNTCWFLVIMDFNCLFDDPLCRYRVSNHILATTYIRMSISPQPQEL